MNKIRYYIACLLHNLINIFLPKNDFPTTIISTKYYNELENAYSENKKLSNEIQLSNERNIIYLDMIKQSREEITFLTLELKRVKENTNY